MLRDPWKAYVSYGIIITTDSQGVKQKNAECSHFMRGWVLSLRERKVRGDKDNWLQGQEAGMETRQPREEAVPHSLLQYRGWLCLELGSHEQLINEYPAGD